MDVSSPLFARAFPHARPRRNRASGWMRAMLAEYRLHASDLIWPVFVHEGTGAVSVASMPGVHRYGLDVLAQEVRIARDLGIPAIALFPAVDPARKTENGDAAFDPDGLVCRAVRLLAREVPDIGIICDVALDPYTTHGHDGIVVNGDVDNDLTLDALTRQALTLARAGCHIIAPSDMMDGRVGVIRRALDAEGFTHVGILSYAVKYASAYYGPFRDAVGSQSALGKRDKRTYQMDPANRVEAFDEIALDIAEGADMLMVKPGMPYLDVVARLSDATTLPVLAYQVSGEYAMLRAAIAQGWLDERAVILESLLAFKRAGARAVLTYAARDAALWLKESCA